MINGRWLSVVGETVSVCMATYNGARFVEHQIDSILAQLEPGDELVVVDDASTDGTAERIEAVGDPRISLHRRSVNIGYVRAFEQAMRAASGDIIFLADQDDEWTPGRRRVLADAVTGGGVAASNLVLLGSDAPLRSPVTGRPWRLRAADSRHRMRNELRILLGDAPYFGCAMALHRSSLPLVLPFPAGLRESHDLWIATAANVTRDLVHVEAATVRRRIHGDNASTERPRGLGAAFRSRLLMLSLWREARRRASRGSAARRR